jgi:tRNA-(ms[2]io[6]A)-hydroxylase
VILRVATRPEWTAAVLGDLDAFLLDHAANERKASASALALVAHYPDRTELVRRCIDLAIEELEHFRAVHHWIDARRLSLGPDTKSEYLRGLAATFRDGSEPYFLDRLLTAAIVEARGCERFGLLAGALPDGALREFYRDLARSEVRHHETYLSLARGYFDAGVAEERLGALLDAEARLIERLPLRPALY